MKPFVFVVSLQAGVATNTFKFGDIKESESNFALRPSLGVEWYIKQRFGISVTAQGVSTKVDDDGADFFMGGCVAACLKFGCSHRRNRVSQY